MNKNEAKFFHGTPGGVIGSVGRDLNTGIITEWTVDPQRGFRKRTDFSENTHTGAINNNTRTITQTRDVISYEVEIGDIGAENHILVEVDARTRFSQHAYLKTTLWDRKKEKSLSVAVGYDGSGNISSVVFEAVPRTPSADRHSMHGHLQGEGESAFFYRKTFGENIGEIAEIWGLRGEKAFLPIDDNYQGKGSEDQETRVGRAISSAEDIIFSKLKEEEVGEIEQRGIFNDVLTVVSRKAYDKLIGKLPYDDCRGIMGYLLVYTSEELARDPESLIEGGELVIEQVLEKAAAQTLAYYYTHVGTIGQSRIQLMSDEEKPGKFKVETESIDEDRGFKVSAGEGFSNGEYELTIDYSGKQCLVNVKPLIVPKETIPVPFPKALDIEDLGDKISQDKIWLGITASLGLYTSSR